MYHCPKRSPESLWFGGLLRYAWVGALFSPPAQQFADLDDHARYVLLLARVEQRQVVAQTQIETQLGERDVGLLEQRAWLIAVGGLDQLLVKPQRRPLQAFGQHESLPGK